MLFHKYRPFRRNYQPEEAILLLYCRFDIKNQRFAPQGRQHLHPFQDIAPIPPRIERHLQRGMLSGKDGTPLVFRQDATAIRLGSADDERPAVRILQRKLLHDTLALPKPSQIERIPPGSQKNRIGHLQYGSGRDPGRSTMPARDTNRRGKGEEKKRSRKKKRFSHGSPIPYAVTPPVRDRSY